MGPFTRARIMVTAGLLLIITVSSVAPMAIGDGVPAIKGEELIGEDPDKVFKTIFESRQLAQVELLNDTHERISLFLSVYSLDPGKDLSVIVPLRTLPVDITGRPVDERDFREEFFLDKAEEMVVRQDPDQAWGRVAHESRWMCQMAMGSMLWTMPGEYVRQTQQPEGYWGGILTGGMISTEESDIDMVVGHYEFDGFTVDVLAVTGGPRFNEYLDNRGLAIPESSVFDDYVDHYVAVVESKSQPPIDPEAYATLQEKNPDVIEALIDELDNTTEKSAQDIYWLKQRLIYRYGQVDRDLRPYVAELVDAVFGRANWTGELLTIDLPLDDGRVFFPLGTSGGWANAIGDIDVLFKVPEGKDLEIRDSEDAYFDRYHWYLFQMENAAPAFDLESEVLDGDPERRDEAANAQLVYDNAQWIALAFTTGLVLATWFGVAYLVARRRGDGRRVLRDPKLWALLGAALLLSLPGALLLYLGLNPVEVKELRTHFVVNDLMALYVVAAALLVVGVAV